MRYLITNGIVYTNVCGAHLLIPSREASEICNGIARISPFEMIVWKLVSKEKSVEEIKTLLSKLFFKPEDEVEMMLQPVFEKFCNHGLMRSDLD